jgi:hypothetical protein
MRTKLLPATIPSMVRLAAMQGRAYDWCVIPMEHSGRLSENKGIWKEHYFKEV